MSAGEKLLAFTIMAHRQLPGVRLSLAGHWGNMPHPDAEAAAQAAREHAGSAPYVIERVRC